MKSESNTMKSEKYHLFWRGPFSQWLPSNFTVNGVKYTYAEQYMMHQKALLFGDKETAKKIMDAKDPHTQKHLGREVKNFNNEKWINNRERIVYEGNYAKFTQNKDLYDILMQTGDKTLVEASPVDKVWGIGLAEDDPNSQDETKWKGLNLLGKVLTKLKEDLKEKEKL